MSGASSTGPGAVETDQNGVGNVNYVSSGGVVSVDANGAPLLSSTTYDSGIVRDSLGDDLTDGNGDPIFLSYPTATRTYGALQARIADEVMGSVTSAHIVNAIRDGIMTYERSPFWFNAMRLRDAFILTVGQQRYTADDFMKFGTMPHIDRLTLVIAGTRYYLRARDADWIDSRQFNDTFTGQPTDWCYDAGAVRFWPSPNQAYLVSISGIKRFAPLYAPTDFNPWTTVAEKLIRCAAKRELYTHVTKSPQEAQVMMMAEQAALDDLYRESSSRSAGVGRIRATRW